MMDRYSRMQLVAIYACIGVFLTFILLPFFEMFMTSLRPLEHLFRAPYQFWSDDFSFDAYRKMWETVPLLGRYIWNSIYISSMVTLLTMILVIPAAYAFARLDFPFKNATLSMFLGVNMFTGAVLLIPLYRVLRTLGLLNTYWAMIVPGVAFLIPTGIWLLRSYLEKIPRELEEAAFVDGASRLYTLRRWCCRWLCQALLLWAWPSLSAHMPSNSSSLSHSTRPANFNHYLRACMNSSAISR